MIQLYWLQLLQWKISKRELLKMLRVHIQGFSHQSYTIWAEFLSNERQRRCEKGDAISKRISSTESQRRTRDFSLEEQSGLRDLFVKKRAFTIKVGKTSYHHCDVNLDASTIAETHPIPYHLRSVQYSTRERIKKIKINNKHLFLWHFSVAVRGCTS